jgi:hypothetical protein
VNNCSEYCAKTLTPSDLICVDESISFWYGQGGEWIYHGLHMYVAMDCKPENCLEIQNAVCGRSSVMIHLKLVKTATEAEVLISISWISRGAAQTQSMLFCIMKTAIWRFPMQQLEYPIY